MSVYFLEGLNFDNNNNNNKKSIAQNLRTAHFFTKLKIEDDVYIHILRVEKKLLQKTTRTITNNNSKQFFFIQIKRMYINQCEWSHSKNVHTRATAK